MKQFSIHGATHFQRKACVKEAIQQQAPPNVISFVGNEAEFKDLKNLEEWLEKHQPGQQKNIIIFIL